MALNLATILTAARDRNQAFHKARISDAVAARWLSEYVNTLIGLACQRDTRYMQQAASIVLALSDANQPGTAGAGTTGGLPGELSSDGLSVAAVQQTTGSLIELGLTSTDGASIVVSERVVTSATDTTVTSTGAARTTNEDAGRILLITAGTGQGQSREIASNTADTWAFADAWTDTSGWVVPDDTSLFEVIAATYELTEGVGVVTAIPSTTSTTGYLVKVNASGTPYLDYTAPLVSSVEHGVALPSFQAVTGGTVRYTDGDTKPLRLVSYAERFQMGAPAVYLVGEELFLCGEDTDWDDVASLEVHYIPVAPALTALTDTLLLPDAAKPCVVAQVAAFMALRTSGMDDVNVNPGLYQEIAAQAESRYLNTLGLNRRAKVSRIREEW